jgi:hypothetical protein
LAGGVVCGVCDAEVGPASGEGIHPLGGLSGILCKGRGVTSTDLVRGLEKITHGAREERRGDRGGR